MLKDNTINISLISQSNSVTECVFTGKTLQTKNKELIFREKNNGVFTYAKTIKHKGLILPETMPESAVPALNTLEKSGLVFFNQPDFLKNLPKRALMSPHQRYSKISDSYPNFNEYDFMNLNELSIFNKRQHHYDETSSIPTSIVLCTNRSDRLPHILPQIFNQIHKNFEIVIVNHGVDSGIFNNFLRIALSEHKAPPPVTIEVLTAPSGSSFGNALSLGCRAASGDFIAKIDDDDFYSKYHLTDLLTPTLYKKHAIVGKPLHYIYIEPLKTTVIRKFIGKTGLPETSSDWCAGGTMLISKDFGEDVSWFSNVNSAVDADIQSKALSQGETIYKTHGGGYVYYRGNENHTWSTSWQRYISGAQHQVLGVYGNF